METQEKQLDDNLVGILAYITLIGWIVALILNNDKKGDAKTFGAFHLRQSLGLMIVAIVISIGLGIVFALLATVLGFFGAMLSTLIFPLFSISILVVAIIGVINAANYKTKPLPIVGAYIEKIFNKTFE